LEPWDFDGNIIIAPDTPMKGKLDMDESVDIPFIFKPTEILRYETAINVQTQVGVTKLRIVGQGACYRFYKASLPDVLQLGMLGFGEILSKPLTLFNDCCYPIQIKGLISSNDPASGEELVPSDCLSLDVDHVDLNPNETEFPLRDEERTKAAFQMTIKVPNPLDAQGVGDPVTIQSMAMKGTKRHYIVLDTVGAVGQDARQVIPVTFSFTTRKLVALNNTMYENLKGKLVESKGTYKVPESDQVRLLDFGECGLESGGTMTVVLHNPNLFKIMFKTEANMDPHSAKTKERLGDNDPSFSVFPDKGTISGLGFREFQVELKGLTVEDGQDVPQSLTCKGSLKLKTNVDTIPELEVLLGGTLVDEVIPLDFSDPLDFGSIRTHFTSQRTFIFQNPVRRPLRYNFRVQKDWADIFVFDSGEKYAEGIAKPREEISIPMTFKPTFNNSYDATGFLETDEGNYTIFLKGTGVEPTVQLDRKKVEFGVVGVGEPEFRRISISNPSTVPIRLGIKSDVEHFKPTKEDEELYLEPGETKMVRLIYSPSEKAKRHSGIISLLNLELRPGHVKPDLLGKLTLEGTGGKYSVKIPNEDETNGPIPVIRVKFPKIVRGQRVRKFFEVENCGDTIVDLIMVDKDGNEMEEEKELTTDKVVYKMEPVNASIPPKSKQKFTVLLKVSIIASLHSCFVSLFHWFGFLGPGPTTFHDANGTQLLIGYQRR
jgi:hypothetical protein